MTIRGCLPPGRLSWYSLIHGFCSPLCPLIWHSLCQFSLFFISSSHSSISSWNRFNFQGCFRQALTRRNGIVRFLPYLHQERRGWRTPSGHLITPRWVFWIYQKILKGNKNVIFYPYNFVHFQSRKKKKKKKDSWILIINSYFLRIIPQLVLALGTSPELTGLPICKT